MAYRYHSQRATRRLARKSRRNLIVTLIIIVFLIYATISWILPNFIGTLGFITSIFKQSKKIVTQENSTLAPPVLNIPFEATNTAQITISGYATPHTKVLIYIDDEQKDFSESNEDGNFEFKDISLSLGTNNIFGKTSDEKGESLPSKTIRVIYDNEKPVLNIFEPEDGKTVQGGDRNIKISGQTEPQAQVYINDTRVVVDSEGKFSLTQNLSDGENNFTIKAVDQASNKTEDTRKVIFNP